MVCVSMRCVHCVVDVFKELYLGEVSAVWSVCVFCSVGLCEVFELWTVCAEFCVFV